MLMASGLQNTETNREVDTLQLNLSLKGYFTTHFFRRNMQYVMPKYETTFILSMVYLHLY